MKIKNGYHFFTFDGAHGYYDKDTDDINKYIVFTCAKGENEYIEEWVNHYLDLGFDKIIICNNNDDDSISYILNPYIENGTVEIFDCIGLEAFQVAFYTQYCIEGNYKWCAYFDCDEFLELTKYSNIKNFLLKYEDCDSVSFNWMVYGHETCQDYGGVKERFKKPIYPLGFFNDNGFIKSIVQGGKRFGSDTVFIGSHIPIEEGKKQMIGGYYEKSHNSHFFVPPRYKEGYIKHYYTKTFDEWVKKASRGWPDGTKTINMRNYDICNDTHKIAFERTDKSFFSNNEDYSKINEYIDTLNTSDVFYIKNCKESVFSYYMMLNSFNYISQGKIFIINEPYIDDGLFDELMERCMIGGNTLVWMNDESEMPFISEKYKFDINSVRVIEI